MKVLVPNPAYEDAMLEGACLDENGILLSRRIAALAFGRIRPPRFKQLEDGSLEEVPSHLLHEKETEEKV